MKKGYLRKRVASFVMAATMIATTILGGKAVKVQAADKQPSNSYAAVKEMGLGYNLGKTFAQSLSWNQDLSKIKKRIDAAYYAGFNTIRDRKSVV